ncbi:hypothetical protein GFD17_00250 [Bifidobacterium sp. SMB2]|uniref:Uncharacterized protein n=1 Tax=Bifidobacterium saimiriisciurei TaxID=2661627 RepID=A0ABX0C810_9BIFI|nr:MULTISPECIES: hypothetical protein [Bifidobacterium]NEG95214.1 hypothetical protein [Bifidobacterium sp. SMB2]NEH11291.1 hypothetical protein [Bifidobacterium saimiriisciurei]
MAKRRISKQQQRIYRRRRIVAVIVLIAVLAVFGGLVYGVVKGVQALTGGEQSQSQTAKSSKSSKDTKSSSAEASSDSTKKPKTTAGVPDCDDSNITLNLSADYTTVGVGGAVNFKTSILHSGGKACLIDASNASRILTITSGNETVWRSDSCDVDSRMLLMDGNDKDIQTVTWNTNRTGSTCQDDASRPHVEAGTYVAVLSLRDNKAVKSDPLTITVQ